jgi:acyl-CoA thioester hydrolase
VSDGITTTLRVRYSETDQMGTFYNSRALEWFEVGRTEWMRQNGIPYADMEHRGILLPLVEAHVEYSHGAVYDDELELRVNVEMTGKARVRFNVAINHANREKKPVAQGHTVHAIVNSEGRPVRPPQWFLDAVQ